MRKGAIHSMKITAAFALACVLALLCTAQFRPASAATLGSIELTCTVDRGGSKVPLTGDGYALTKVASAEVFEDTASAVYTIEEAFRVVDRDWLALDGAGLRAAAREVADHAAKQGIEPLRKDRTGPDGKVTFAALEPGIYLIERYEVASANAVFSCDPMLIGVPVRVGDALDYSVEVSPKFEVEEPNPGPGPGPGPDPEPGPDPDPDPNPPVDPDEPGPDPDPNPDPDGPDGPGGDDQGDGSDGGSGNGGNGGLGQLADKVAQALGFAKTSDGMMALAAAAAACACAAAAVLVVWRRKAAAEPRGAHAAGAKKAVDSAGHRAAGAKRAEQPEKPVEVTSSASDQPDGEPRSEA